MDGKPELKLLGLVFPMLYILGVQFIYDRMSRTNFAVPQSVVKEFLSDIFGMQTGSHFEAGLVDAESELPFMTALTKLKYRWNNLEKSCISSGTEPQFHAWFCKFKADDIIRCVLPDVRSRAGTDPCKLFTTNSSEAINHIIKQEVQWRENKPTLIEHLKTITVHNQAKLEKAITGQGEWRFCSEYTYLQVSESVWFSSMKSEAKDKHLKVQTVAFGAHVELACCEFV